MADVPGIHPLPLGALNKNDVFLKAQQQSVETEEEAEKETESLLRLVKRDIKRITAKVLLISSLLPGLARVFYSLSLYIQKNGIPLGISPSLSLSLSGSNRGTHYSAGPSRLSILRFSRVARELGYILQAASPLSLSLSLSLFRFSVFGFRDFDSPA